MSHTEGKLSAFRYSISNAEDKVIATVGGPLAPGHQEDVARRLVACWNACQGIPLEQLEYDQPTFVRMLLERQTLKKERDELLKALRSIHAEIHKNGLPTVCEENAYELAGKILSRYPEE